ncbi:MAG: response regulator [Saprospiraceae bacterium]|nr:response regulator [Saprospiraceae bacterium]
MTFYPEVKSLKWTTTGKIATNHLQPAVQCRQIHTRKGQGHPPCQRGDKTRSTVSTSIANSTNNHFLQIKISNTGIGISAEHIANIFDRFYQADDAHTRKGEGTGIGLTLTKELVELLGGSISVKSEIGQGAEFTVRLPVRKSAVRSLDLPQIETAVPASGTMAEMITSAGSIVGLENDDAPLLLLIEDNADVATYIRTCLEGQYKILWAEDGQSGIDKALETIPDIIISDVMMPEKDGFEVTQFLKNDERTCHIPIILLTAKADVESRLEGLGVGADAYLSKPFLKEELLIRLEKLVELRQRLQQKYAAVDFVALATNAPAQATASLEAIFFEKASRSILGHLDDANFGNEELAREMAMSESQLNRKLKALTGKTLSLFIRSIRLQQAKILLETTHLNISEIAYAVGFADPAYFTRTFSQEFGGAPSRFRG